MHVVCNLCVLILQNTAASALTPVQRRARYSALADDQRQYLAEKLSVVVRVLAARSAVTAANDLADAWWRWKVSKVLMCSLQYRC